MADETLALAQRERAARAIDEFLRALGYELRGELEGTGRRVADAWIDELVAGTRTDPRTLLAAGAIEAGPGPHGVVVLRGIRVATMCPHHLLPAHGTATVGFLPKSKLA